MTPLYYDPRMRAWSLGLAVALTACGDGASSPSDGGHSGDGAMVDAPVLGGGNCGQLAMPTGRIVDVTPSQAGQLGSIAAAAQAGDVLRLADGTYPVSGDVVMNLSKANITLISASRDASKVILDGGPSHGAREIVQASASSITIAHVTIRNARDHLIHFYPGGGADLHGIVIYGVVLEDGGQQFLKSNTDQSPQLPQNAHFVDDVTIACSRFTMTAAGRAYVPTNPSNASYPCYTGGIDAHAARGWRVQDNRFEGIYCDVNSLAEHAIHFWQTGRDQVIERNVLVNNARGIGLGLGDGTGLVERPYSDNPHAADKIDPYVGNYDGLIANNMIYADIARFDSGISVEQAMGARIVHNTVFRAGAAQGNAIEYRFENSLVELRNNLANEVRPRDMPRGTVDHNVTSVTAAMFVAPAAGDLHLTASNDQGAPITGITTDLDGDPRSASTPDVGADEK